VSAVFLTQSQHFPTIADRNDIGGIANAINSSLLIDGIAVAISVPLAIVLAVAMYESDNRFFNTLRLLLEVMIGLPSILLGIFIYSIIVVPLSNGVGTVWAGSLAIALLMTPLMAIAGEAALRGVPSTLTEAGLALGARRSSVMRRVIFPFAIPRILTGILLSLSRAVGETAPLLVITGVSIVVNWNPSGQATAMPVLIYDYLQSQYPAIRNACWGIALVLMAAVLVLNLSSRIIVARTSKGRS
jgi:phosphate transport system permease protein